MEKSLSILSQIDIPAKERGLLEAYFQKLSRNEYIYPNRLAAKTGISKEKASEVLYDLVLSRVLTHVTVPFRPETRELFEDNALEAIVDKFPSDFMVIDQDFNEIHGNELVPVAAFKLKVY